MNRRNDRTAGGTARIARRRPRRGVASVIAMMFLVIFGSLAAAMAVVAQGNLRTADSALKVSRAQSAAESGLVFAARRLGREGARFVIERGVVDATYASELWNGNWGGGGGAVTVLPPVGFDGPAAPDGLAEAIRDAHLADASAFAPLPEHAGLPAIVGEGVLVTSPLRIEGGNDRLWFQLVYEPVEGTPNVRVTSIGVDGEIRRSISMEFRIAKRIEYAVLSPNRVMIGKNVIVEGPLGTRYGTEPGELTEANGDPLVMRSDFRYLTDALTARIETLAAAVATHDVDGNARLRPSHPFESQGLSGTGLEDLDGDGYVDDFDCFLAEYDADADGSVVWDAERALAAGVESGIEFSGIDDQLARLIDLARPDRNDDGTVDARDVRLGYSDGVLNAYDRYAKVSGSLVFGVTEEAWESAAGENWRGIAQGPVRARSTDDPVRFGVGEDELRLVTTADFADSAAWFATAVANDFASQAAAAIAAGGTYTAPADAGHEAVPFGSSAAYDYFERPVYENMTFRDVRIPKGLNPLFRNCRFEGTVYLETETACTDVNWNYAGALSRTDNGDGTFTYALRFPGIVANLGGTTLADTRSESSNVRFDGCTFLGSIAGDTPAAYTHWRNKVQITGATRFYSDPDDPDLLAQPDANDLRDALVSLGAEKLDRLQRSSVMLPGWSVDVGNFANEVAEDPDLTARIRMKGTVVAGIMDIRGTADIEGTLLMTFRPVPGEGALAYNGQPEAFNTTLGYFGSLDGDGEGALPGEAGFAGFGEIRLRYDPDAKLPDGIPWPASVEPVPETYREGGLPG